MHTFVAEFAVVYEEAVHAVAGILGVVAVHAIFEEIACEAEVTIFVTVCVVGVDAVFVF